MLQIALRERPRMGAYAEKDGSYEQVVVIRNAVISPGDKIIIEQLFTGYGKIYRPKISFFPSVDVYDSATSHVRMGLGRQEDGHWRFGEQIIAIESAGLNFSLTGMSDRRWDDSTFFFDVTSDIDRTPMILTETRTQYAPVHYELTTKKKIKPGKYTLEFYFTYFNGSSWKTSGKKVDFQVQNFFERNEMAVKWIGIVGAILGFGKVLIEVGRWAIR